MAIEELDRSLKQSIVSVIVVLMPFVDKSKAAIASAGDLTGAARKMARARWSRAPAARIWVIELAGVLSLRAANFSTARWLLRGAERLCDLAVWPMRRAGRIPPALNSKFRRETPCSSEL